ncbi:AfsA-related hotdog domain-containing protein [Rhodococcus oryzae]|uniref:AfsA-related hotdog domain-containing protein n=1 Tax=Rhodococcus oryzae TaxID=2571143 RepID=UPI003799DA16
MSAVQLAPAALSPQHPAAEVVAAIPLTDLVVVADRFRGFADGTRVHTVSGLVTALRGGAFRNVRTDLTIRLGQGIKRHDKEYVEHVASIHAPASEVRLLGDIAAPAPRHHVHKYQETNVLIANLARAEDGSFTADLRIDGDNELLIDHQTGEHVQGLVIVEAARQLFLGAFELEYGIRSPEQHYYVVWNSIDLSFKTFLFPLPASLHARFGAVSIQDPAKLQFTIDIEVTQFGRSVATATISFAALENSTISQIERRKAAKAIEAFLGATA